jgi:8-oxo-dGTP pyrophosphatase MutT (NUDIX family)
VTGEPEVRAAGGVVVRGVPAHAPGAAGSSEAGPEDGSDVGPEVAVIHRPRYDDWSFPKGKCDPGESYGDAARREVAEETGLRCELGRELGDTRYRDSKGREKLVRYWVMPAPEGADAAVAAAVPNPEVDELRWLAPAEAARLLTYVHDRELLGRLLGGDPLADPPGPDGSAG